MNHDELISALEKAINRFFGLEVTGHDLAHALRVKNLAMQIAKIEGGDQKIIEIAALVHDVFDWKFKNDNQEVVALLTNYLNESEYEQVLNIANSISFKGALSDKENLTLEGMIVQDADRLDAIGAIGIARAFAFGGHHDQLIYDPNLKPRLHQNFEEYKNQKSTTINHFYEKLLLLKEKLNTQTAKRLAEKRHQLMLDFLSAFFEEWV